ncbi:helix-turn-helix domain-containing protein [Winogradskyella sp. 3972H.M.0a.05]|uniref:helix-turn-helix domain-containing protein n=1 Tax=Winogradskyella sp. 3972H.M.0a.05 TaxID=2950277 RepID=UPI00339AFBD5
MVSKFTPEIGKVYFVNDYSMYQILSGHGSIEVDFKTYLDWEDKIIFLEKGQYIKFLSEDFEVRKFVFDDEIMFRSKDVRVLFKHLISLGYINFKECEDCHSYLTNTVFSDATSDIIDMSSKQWYWQNPFHANKDEYHLIFDVKEVIDTEYNNNLTNDDVVALIGDKGYKGQALVKNKVGLSVKNLLLNKRILEGQKQLAFTDKPVQEIADELGYNDTAYFNKIFKVKSGVSPLKFRSDFEFDERETFVQDILELLKTYHTSEHQLGFYADKMHLSVKALSKKVKTKLNTSLGQLIRAELIHTAKQKLLEGAQVNDIAFQLGFEESNHFTTFFKKHTTFSPTQFREEKVQL